MATKSTSTPVSHAKPAKPAVPAAVHHHAKMFGVDVDLDDHKAIERPPMSRNAKAGILAGVLAVAVAGVLYMQFRPANQDPDAADHPAVAQVTQAVKTGDTTALAQLSRNDDPIVALRAVTALGNLGGTDSLRDSLNDRRPEVRAAAVGQIADRPDVSQLPVLSQALADQDVGVRIAALRGVAAIDDFSIFDHLIPMLNDPDPAVRRGALSAIQERSGLKFSNFDPAVGGTSNQAAVAHIRATIPKFKERFETAKRFEANRSNK